MKTPWTKESLEELAHKKLDIVYHNALASSDPDAARVLDLFEQHRLLSRLGGGYRQSHKLIVDMERICRSAAGVAAAVGAASKGEAPMAGVDPILQVELGPEYGQRDSTTWAGTFVAEEMLAEGWLRKGRKSLPSNCKAKTAAFFIRKESPA